MNKKLYFLDEDEKNRILNLHESRTKKQYLLSEQTIPSMFQPISQVFSEPTEKKSKEEKQTQRPTGWEKYPCVVKKGGKDMVLTYKGKKQNGKC